MMDKSVKNANGLKPRNKRKIAPTTQIAETKKRKKPMKSTVTKDNATIKEHKTSDLKQMYIVCPTEKRWHVLFTFIKKNLRQKLVIIFNSELGVEFYQDLLSSFGTSVMAILKKKNSKERNSIFKEFSIADSAILLCTSEFAGKRLNSIPPVDWVVQYDPPGNLNEYVNLLKTIRKDNKKKGEALLFLTDEEIGFSRYLKTCGVDTEFVDVTWAKVNNNQIKLEKLVSTQYFIYLGAKQALSGFMKGYAANQMKEVFDVEKLDYALVAKCFGFKSTLFVDLAPPSEPKAPKKKRKVEKIYRLLR